MKFCSLLFPLAMLMPAAAELPPAATPTKVAIIQFQAAVVSTQEGRQAEASLRAKFDPRKSQLEKRQAELQAIDEKLKKGGATLAADARAKLERDLSSGTRDLNRDAEDLNSEVQEEQNKVLQGMASKMGEIIKDYATKNGYAVVLDVSSQQSSVLWASPAVNITADIVKLYDQSHPVKSEAAPANAKPQTPASPAPSGAKPPASKKQ